MSMQVVILRNATITGTRYETGWEGFIPRSLGRKLCQQGIAIPWSLKDYSPEYKAMVKRKKKAAAEKKEKAVKKPKQKPREKAVSKKVETREKAILE